MLDMFNIK